MPATAAPQLTAWLNPLAWSPAVYLALVVVLLVLHRWAPWSDRGAARFVHEFCLVLPAGLLYFVVRGATEGRADEAIARGERIIELERRLGIFVEDDLQRAILDAPRLVDLANWVYMWAHWPVILGWVGWIWWRHSAAYLRYRNAFLISGAIGLVGFALFPTAPPRLLPDWGFVDTVLNQSRSYRVLQPPALTDLYAAMPSLHFGWDLLVAIAIVRHAGSRLARAVAAVLPIAMFLSIVLTANHYILDGVAGGAVALTGLALAGALERWRAGHPSSTGRPRATGRAASRRTPGAGAQGAGA